MKLDMYLLPVRNANTEWIVNINVGPKPMKLLTEKTEELMIALHA
jgi:hypothetical protein